MWWFGWLAAADRSRAPGAAPAPLTVGSPGGDVAQHGVVDSGAVAGVGDEELGDGIESHGRLPFTEVWDTSDGKEDGVRDRPAMA